MKNIIESIRGKKTPKAIADTIIASAERQTETSREWMEKNPNLKLPQDYCKYPGKMDHITCLAFVVDFFE